MNKKTTMRQAVLTPQTKIWNTRFITLMAVNAMNYLSMMSIGVLISKYAGLYTGSSTIIGMVVSSMAISSLVMKLVASPVLATFNRRKILSLAMTFMAVSFIGLSFSKSIPVIIIFRLVHGIGLAFASPCFMALAADALPDDKITAGIGYFTLVQATCQAIGPSIGLALATSVGYQITFAGSGILMLAASVTAFFLVKTVDPEKKVKFSISLNNIFAKEALLPAFLIFILEISFFTINSFLVLYAEGLGVSGIGAYFTVYSVVLLLTRPIVGKIADRIGTWKVLLPSLGCFAISFFLLSVSRSLGIFLLAAVIQSFGNGAAIPLLQALVVKSVPKERRSVATCTGYLGTDTGSLLGPVIGGVLVDAFGYRAMWDIMIVPVVVAAIIIYNRRVKLG